MAGWLPLWTINVDDKSNRSFAHLLIYPSAWLPFFPHQAISSFSSLTSLYITFNWIPAMKFHPRRYSRRLFFSFAFSLIVLSRETISQPSFLTGFLSAQLTLCVPSCLRLVPDFSFFSDNCILIYTRRAFLSTMQSSKITARHTVFKMDQICATTLILLGSTSTCMECSRAAGWRIHPNADCLRLNVVTCNTRNSYSDTRYHTLLSRGFMYVQLFVCFASKHDVAHNSAAETLPVSW